MEKSHIEDLAEQVLEALDMVSLPVDPLDIASQEGIILVPGKYRGAFDGRIEYRKRQGRCRFCLFYSEEDPPWRPAGRVRFSIAHELGHYYIPAHRDFLLSGRWHGSRADFVSDKPTEREADHFAAALLMPRRLFHKEVARRSQRVCALEELLHLASNVFLTSVTSTAIRYCELNYEPCCIVVSEEGHIRYPVISDDMRELCLGWLPKGGRVPASSVTAKVLKAASAAAYPSPPLEAPIDSDVWFESGCSRRLWEEAILLGRTGLALTLLSAESSVDDDD